MSLRECFLFLAIQGASDNYYAKNEMHPDSWTVTRKSFYIATREHITDDDSQSASAQQETQAGSAFPQTETVASEARINQPTLGGGPRPQALHRHTDVAIVHFEERTKQSFFVDPKGRKVYVEVRRNADGTIYFELSGKKYAAQWADRKRK